VSESDINVILHRLDEMRVRLDEIHSEVKRTNGRVTSLEMEEARWQAKEESKRVYSMVAMTVVSGAILAGVVWFVQAAI
jgi:intergrase/recombinase